MVLDLALIPIALAFAEPSARAAATDVQHQFERWERRLRARVAELHILPSGSDKNAIGDVVISFSVGSDGRPADAIIRKSFGTPLFDRTARRLVRHLGRVGPVPSMTGGDHRVVLKLSYGVAATSAADRELASALEVERKAHSRRNLEIVTGGSDRTEIVSQQRVER